MLDKYEPSSVTICKLCGNETTEHNDLWLKYKDGDRFYDILHDDIRYPIYYVKIDNEIKECCKECWKQYD